jgi:Fur family transcriptional regulator, peroxide stress response regulator
MESKSLINILHQAGMRVTPQRIAICDFLTHSEDHPTATDVFTKLKDQYPSLSLTTVYNTLDVLVGVGMVNVLGSIGDNRVHFDANLSPHINLACLQCHKIVDTVSNCVNELDSEISQKSGYQIKGSRILYFGTCPECLSILQ